jgi:sigma-E factor negative regulatory protein RseB
MIVIRLLVTLIFMSSCAHALADPPQQVEMDWLKSMAFAAHKSNYSGTFVYQSGDRVEVSRVTHVADQSGEHERLEGLDGNHREIIRNNDEVWLFSGDRKIKIEKHRLERAFPALLPDKLTTLKDNYVIRHGDEEIITGFHAHAVVFQPKDNLRYSHKMWADSASGLLLKAAVLDERGRVIEQYAFTQLSIGQDIDRNWIVPTTSGAAYLAQKLHLAPLPKLVALPDTDGWQIDAMPSGFNRIMAIRHQIREKSNLVTHLVYTDGLVGISVFIESVSRDASINTGLSSQGAVQIFSKTVEDHLITVVGEVPPRTVIQVADSVRYAGK